MSGRFIFKTLFFPLFILCIAGTPDGAAAVGDPPPWVEALDCKGDPQVYEQTYEQVYEQKYDGLQFCQTKDDSAYVVVIDLNTEGIQIEYVIAEGYDRNGYYGECKDVNLPMKDFSNPGCHASNRSYYPVMSLMDAVGRMDSAAVVINSDYGAGDQGEPGEFRGHGPEGFAVIRGNRIDGRKNNDTDNNAENRPWLAISQGSPIRAELNQYAPGEDDKGKADWIYTGVGGGPWLIRDGTVQADVSDVCQHEYRTSCYDGAVQTLVGISSDDRWLFFVILKSTSKDMHEAIELLKTLDVKNAIKMDGGRSSQLYYGGLTGASLQEKIVTDGGGRKLSQYLAIIAGPGSGIKLDGSPVPSEPGSDPDSDLSWWEKVQKSWNDFWTGVGDKINKWWEEQEKKLAEKIDDWWQEQQRKLAEWWERQLVEWLNQLCGSAALVPLALAAAWITNHRKHNRHD